MPITPQNCMNRILAAVVHRTEEILMTLKQSASLSAAILAATLAVGLPGAAVAQQTGQTGQTSQAGQQAGAGMRSISVGHNVVDAVDDVRETTADFVGALLGAEEGLGLGNWKQQEQRLSQIEEQLKQMETVLDQKADATDQEWLDWMGGPDYSVTVTKQIKNLGSHLDQVSNILAENWQTKGIQVLIGSNVLDQLRDLRETTGDLLNSMENAGNNYGWTVEPNKIKQARDRLAKLAEDIDQPLVMSEADWRAYLESDRFHIVIHDNVSTLADILQNLAKPNQG